MKFRPGPQTIPQKSPPTRAPELPGVGKLVANATRAVVRHARAMVAGGAIKVAGEEANRRLAICQACPAFRPADERCGKCGCHLRWKTWLRAERCPDARW